MGFLNARIPLVYVSSLTTGTAAGKSLLEQLDDASAPLIERIQIDVPSSGKVSWITDEPAICSLGPSESPQPLTHHVADIPDGGGVHMIHCTDPSLVATPRSRTACFDNSATVQPCTGTSNPAQDGGSSSS